jgi:hypothetical protein
MSKTLTDQELKKQFQTLGRDQLENNLKAKIVAEATYQKQIQELDLKVNDLKYEIKNLTSISEQLRSNLWTN